MSTLACRGIEMCGGDLSAKRLAVHGGDTAVHTWCKEGPVTVKLVDCTLSGSRLGIAAVGHELQATILRGAVQKMRIAAEFRAGAVGRVNGTKFVRCEEGIQVGDVMQAVLGSGSQCPMCGLSGQAAFEAAFRKLWESGGKGVPGARCAHAGAISRVTITDVHVDRGKDGVVVHYHGYLDATRATVTECELGFFMQYNTVRSRFTDCKAVNCGTPVAANARPNSDFEEVGAAVMSGIEVVKNDEWVSRTAMIM